MLYAFPSVTFFPRIFFRSLAKSTIPSAIPIKGMIAEAPMTIPFKKISFSVISTSLELVAGVTLSVVINVACDNLQAFLAKVCDSCSKTQAPELLQRF
jgi:hypothetical protein